MRRKVHANVDHLTGLILGIAMFTPMASEAAMKVAIAETYDIEYTDSDWNTAIGYAARAAGMMSVV